MNNGLFCTIYKSADGYDCTLNGVSSEHNNMYVFTEDYAMSGYVELEEVDDTVEVLVIIERSVAGKTFPIAVPYIDWLNGTHGMFGGNFVWTSDSRFNRVFGGPVKIFDRNE